MINSMLVVLVLSTAVLLLLSTPASAMLRAELEEQREALGLQREQGASAFSAPITPDHDLSPPVATNQVSPSALSAPLSTGPTGDQAPRLPWSAAMKAPASKEWTASRLANTGGERKADGVADATSQRTRQQHAPRPPRSAQGPSASAETAMNFMIRARHKREFEGILQRVMQSNEIQPAAAQKYLQELHGTFRRQVGEGRSVNLHGYDRYVMMDHTSSAVMKRVQNWGTAQNDRGTAGPINSELLNFHERARQDDLAEQQASRSASAPVFAESPASRGSDGSKSAPIPIPQRQPVSASVSSRWAWKELHGGKK